jgi:hypothetical protein
VRVHDFAIPGLGKVAPYSVYDIAANSGWIRGIRGGEHPSVVARTRTITLPAQVREAVQVKLVEQESSVLRGHCGY